MENEVKEKKRTVAQDAAKGLMIISVVFFHCYLVCLPDPSAGLTIFNLLSCFFPFLLSSFFFYTGYNYKDRGRSIKESIIRRTKQLIIPMIVVFFINTILIGSMVLAMDHADIGKTFQTIGETVLFCILSQPLAMFVGVPASGIISFEIHLAIGILWFILVLYICSIFFYILVPHTNKNLVTLISVDILLLLMSFAMGQFISPYLPFTVQCYPMILALMLTAAYLRQWHFLNRRVESKKHSILMGVNAIVAEGLIVGTCLLCHYQFGAFFTGSLPAGQFDPALGGFDAIISFFFGILGTYFLHTLCRLIKHIPVVGFALAYIGNHSSTFYLFHPIFVVLVSTVIFQKNIVMGDFQPFFYVFVVVVLLVGLCLLLDFIVKKKHIERPIVEEINANKDEEA